MKYLILGSGPAGLTFANKLSQMGEKDFLILEKESESGGLCRSAEVDGYPLDIGGGHFLDVRHSDVLKFLFDFMPEEEWNKYKRDSRIKLNEIMVNHPIEANIWQMDLTEQVKYLKSIATADCHSKVKMPEKFVDWIYWKFGSKIAEDYMLPYNQKIFGKSLEQLGTYWLNKLPNVSFEETLLSCLTKRAYGTQPGHTEFYYPQKYGYGELWLRMAEAVKEHIVYEKIVNGINFTKKSVRTVNEEEYHADIIVTTIPWMEFKEIIGMPEDIQSSIKELKANSIQIEYFPEQMNTEAHWIYYPDTKLKYHRILVRHNFCLGSKGYWTETNCEYIDRKESTKYFKYINSYAYPLNTINKPQIMKSILAWCQSQGVIGLGRWGEHQHYNSDVTVKRAINLAINILK